MVVVGGEGAGFPGAATRTDGDDCRSGGLHPQRRGGLVDVPDQRSQDQERWPDLLLFLGDQVYADETSEEMREFIEQRRDPAQAPWYELKDYEEYAHLYALAWSDPPNRWLLSTLPSAMIFDDHDIRDDWNTSYAWRQEIEQTSWWH